MEQNKYYQLLERSLQRDWSFPDAGGRNLSHEKVSKYLEETSDPLYREFVKVVLDHTKYVSYQDLLINLAKSFRHFQESIRHKPFWISFPLGHKVGSENWLIFLLWPWLREMNVEGIITYQEDSPHPPSNSHILIVDDAIYSGNNVLGTIDRYTFELKSKGLPTNFIYHLLIPYVSKDGKSDILTFIRGGPYCFFRGAIEFHESVTTYQISTLLDGPLMTNYDKISRAYRINGFPVPIYFDHKVGNHFASFPQIYLKGFIPPHHETGSLLIKNPSRDIIYQVRDFINNFLGINLV